MAFVNRMNLNVDKYRTGIQMKKSRCSLFVSILDVVLQSVWVLYRINKDEADESVVLVAFRRHVANAFFLKHSEEDRLSSNHVESGNMPSDI